MDILFAAAVALTSPSSGSSDLRPAPLILQAPETFKAIPEVIYLPDGRSDTIESTTAWG